MDSRPEKRTEQDALLEIQSGAAKKARLTDVLTIAVFIVFIYALAIAMYIIPDQEFSEQENRVLQQFPKVSSQTGENTGIFESISSGKFLDRLIDGRFTSEIAKYYADQFPARDFFVGVKGVTEIAMLKRENNGVVLGSDGYIIKRGDNPNYEAVKSNIESIINFSDAMREVEIPFMFALAGRSVDALEKYLPKSFPNDESSELWEYISSVTGQSPDMQFINLLDPLKTAIKSGEQLYYKTDHHWTTRGAYYAYAEIMKAMGQTPQTLSTFVITEVAEDFYGTTWSSAGMKWIKPDIMNFYRFLGDDSYFETVIQDTGEVLKGFYDQSYLKVKDKYSAFIGGNYARVDITMTNGKNRKTLLMIKDSFGHSLAPFLAYHFDLIIIDLRYYTDSVGLLAVDEDVDYALVINNAGNITEGNVFGLINYGLDGLTEHYEDLKQAEAERIAKEIASGMVSDIYINGNSVLDYTITYPANNEEYAAAAEVLRDALINRMGITLEIEASNDLTQENKSLILSDTGLPANGLIQIIVEGNNLVFRSTSENGIAETVNRFVNSYLKDAKGKFSLGSDFVYSDADNEVIIKPNK